MYSGLPTEAYKVVEEIHDDGTPTNKTFEHVATEIGAEEAEEVGVEHLLRSVIFYFKTLLNIFKMKGQYFRISKINKSKWAYKFFCQ